MAVPADRTRPTRAGTSSRRRNRALASWRRARAVELATLGMTYDAIAREVGFTNRGTAYRVVRDALAQQTSQAVQALRQQQLDRLDALQATVWPRAMTGDLKAVLTAVRIVTAQCRLLGLDRPERDPDRPAPASVVVPPEELP